jgi:hypothetical protein
VLNPESWILNPASNVTVKLVTAQLITRNLVTAKLVTAKLSKFRPPAEKFAATPAAPGRQTSIGRYRPSQGGPMQRKHLALPVAAALALSLSACGKDADENTSTIRSHDPALTAKGPETMSSALGERPGSPANPRGLSDTSPSIPGSAEKEQPFGQGSPQTSMKGADIPSVARPSGG